MVTTPMQILNIFLLSQPTKRNSELVQLKWKNVCMDWGGWNDDSAKKPNIKISPNFPIVLTWNALFSQNTLSKIDILCGTMKIN